MTEEIKEESEIFKFCPNHVTRLTSKNLPDAATLEKIMLQKTTEKSDKIEDNTSVENNNGTNQPVCTN